jgi:salicylate hydroxylase
MLPFGGQGSNQAIEDAGALGRILSRVSSLEELQASLKVFESVRIGRASAIQTLSKVRVGREMDVEQEVKQYFSPGAKVPSSFPERSGHAFWLVESF